MAQQNCEQDLEAEYERGYLDGYRAARQHVLTSLFGADVLRDMLDEARADEQRTSPGKPRGGGQS